MVAADSLRSSKLRSFLTLLGIILATTTLIAVMAVINGMNLYVAETVSTMGSEGFRVVRMAFVGEFDPKKFVEWNRKNPQLTLEEFEFLKANVKLSRELAVAASRRSSVSSQRETIEEVTLTGTSPNFHLVENVQIAQGRFFTEIEDRKKIEVAFIGNDLKERFFPTTDAAGKTVDIAGRPFTVVGVAKARGSAFGQSQDNFVYIPAGTYFKMYGARRGMAFLALARDQSVLEQAQDEVRSLLRVYRHLGPGREDNFSILNSEALANAWKQLTGTIAGAAIAIVSVFMVVGGVVIMNIMLAVVTERTREIGIRKAAGARRVDILRQFLVESSMLSGAGGVIGVLLATVIAIVVRNFTPVPMQVPLAAVVVSVGVSTAVGLFFGIYPARRASRLDPIEALRFET